MVGPYSQYRVVEVACTRSQMGGDLGRPQPYPNNVVCEVLSISTKRKDEDPYLSSANQGVVCLLKCLIGGAVGLLVLTNNRLDA